ncbi:MAG: hypothetical protein HWD90_08065 [Campylobacteraceae bacterium]|nr:hypothetical protein [Campylobacteraceae bacterium]
MEVLLVIIGLSLIAFLVFYFGNNTKQKEYRSSALKKEELIQKYEDEMKAIIEEYKDDPDTLTIKKIEYLKKASNKIHNNIFFSDSEAKALVQRLASL